jgi:hypothetical protein
VNARTRALLWLACLLVTLLGFPSALAQTTLLTPANRENTSDSTPYFSWVTLSEGENYRLLICGGTDSPNPADNLYDRWLTENFDNFDTHPENSLPDGLWWWGVRVENQPGGPSGEWSWRLLRVDTVPPAIPALSLPRNGENLNTLKVRAENLGRENSYPLLLELFFDQPPPDVLTLLSTVYTDNRVAGVSVGGVPLSLSSSYVTRVGEGWRYTHRYSGWVGGSWASVGLDLECDGENAIENLVYYRWGPLPSDGLHSLVARARDNAGNLGENSENRLFRLDTLPPSPPVLLSPTEGALLGSATPTLSWSPVEENSLPVRYWVEVDTSPAFNTENHQVWESALPSCATPPLFEGTWYWRVKAIDGALNFGNWSPAQRFTLDLTPPAAPSLTRVPPSLSNSSSPSFAWSPVSDPHGLTYWYMLAGHDQSWKSTSSTGVSYTGVPDGAYIFRLKARDGAGNESGACEYSFTVDTTPPAPPTLSGPLANAPSTATGWSYTSTVSSFNLSGKVDPRCRVYLNDAPLSVAADGSFSKTLSLIPGTNRFTLRIVDQAGNVTTRTLDVYYPGAPTAPSAAPTVPGEAIFAVAVVGFIVVAISLITRLR